MKMNSKTSTIPIWRIHIRNLLVLLPFPILLLIMTSLLCCMGEATFPVCLYPFAFGFCLAAYIIRYYVHKIIPFYLLHVLILVIPILSITYCHNPIIIGFCLFFAIAQFIYGHNYWISDSLSVVICLKPVLVIAGLFAYIFTLSKPGSPYQLQIFVLCILYILTSNFAGYIVSLQEYEQENARNDSISLAPVLKKNTKIVILLFAMLFLLAFLANTTYLQMFFSKIFNTIGTFIRDILASLLNDSSNSTVPIEPEPSEPAESYNMFIVRQSSLGKILGIIFDALANLLFFTIISYIAYRFLKFLLTRGRRNTAMASNLNDDGVLESRTRLTRPKNKQKRTRRRGPEDKIRNQYYKTILNYQKRGYNINPTHSPSERATDINIQYNNDLTTLTKQYEQARYQSPDNR